MSDFRQQQQDQEEMEQRTADIFLKMIYAGLTNEARDLALIFKCAGLFAIAMRNYKPERKVA